jgi:hypothetical protein
LLDEPGEGIGHKNDKADAHLIASGEALLFFRAALQRLDEKACT